MVSIQMDNKELNTSDHFQLNKVLVKMVLNGLISKIEREQLLHKAKLLKLKDGKWKDENGSILTLHGPETID